MMRSMFSGVSGLRIHQTKMDVIANNIANVNTNGYKSSRVTFAEIFSQTTAGASGANAATGRGGVNAMQIGLGSNVASIDMLMTSGAAQRTDNPYDLMIQGDGFFIMGDSSGTYFTRAGSFRLDESGFLVGPNGMVLQGWKAVPGTLPGTTTIQKTGTQSIQISGTDEAIGAEMTTYIDFTGNLNGITDVKRESSMSFFDSLGNKYIVKVQFEYKPGSGTSPGTWEISLADRAQIEGTDRIVYLTPAGTGVGTPNLVSGDHPQAVTITTKAAPVPDTGIQFTKVGEIAFTDTGILDLANTTSLQLTINDAAGVIDPESKFSVITASLMNLTQNAGTANASSETKDGAKPGTLNGISIGSDGKVTGRYSNGKTKVLWQIPIVKFKNPAGLERVGNNLYVTTPNSGDFDGVGEEASGGTSILPGVLEMSNVDLAAEFTEMITTQRGFQANSRIITTSDDMLQELVNLKR